MPHKEVHIMPKGTNQKLKLYYLSRIMTEKTDDEHVITMPEIQRELERYPCASFLYIIIEIIM